MSKFDEIRMPPKSKDDFYIFPDLRKEAKPSRTWFLICYLIKNAQNVGNIHSWLNVSFKRLNKIMLFTETHGRTACRNLEKLGWIETRMNGRIKECRITKAFYDSHKYTLAKQP